MPLGIVSDKDFEKEILNNGVDVIKNNTIPKEPRASLPTLEIPSNPEVQEDNPIITSDVLTMKRVGRHNDVDNVPMSLRKVLGEEHAIHGLKSAQSLANSLGGLSQPTLSTYGRGQVSNGQSNDEMLTYINSRKTKISKRALNKLNLALSLIDDQKLMPLKATELSTVAKDMAIVAKQMEPSVKEDEKKDPVQFIMYAPQIRNENNYEVVQAKDNY